MPHTTVFAAPAEPARAPIRDDWAYEEANEIYALVASSPRPLSCVDVIAAYLRTAHIRGEREALQEALADMERR